MGELGCEGILSDCRRSCFVRNFRLLTSFTGHHLTTRVPRIYAVRAAASKYFEYRISKSQRYLDDLQKQRDETIEKLKVATKYNSTQQLLEKYAGESPTPQRANKSGDEKRKSEAKRKPANVPPPVQRTGLAPPPTANIPRPTPPQSPQPAPSPDSQHPPSPYAGTPLQQPAANTPQPQSPPQPPFTFDEPGFAPNAFPSAPQYVEQSHWYDRLLDVLLGEDETQPKNRIALICSTCRLVNGQAPPGIKTLEELGRWRCGSCGSWNGEESETKKVLAGIRKPAAERSWAKADPETNSSVGDATDEGVMVAEDDLAESRSSDGEVPVEEEEEEEEPIPEPEPEPEPEPQPQPKARSTRGRPKGSKNKK